MLRIWYFTKYLIFHRIPQTYQAIGGIKKQFLPDDSTLILMILSLLLNHGHSHYKDVNPRPSNPAFASCLDRELSFRLRRQCDRLVTTSFWPCLSQAEGPKDFSSSEKHWRPRVKSRQGDHRETGPCPWHSVPSDLFSERYHFLAIR